MFFAAVLASADHLERARTALALHERRLSETGWSGRFTVRPFPGGLLAWDADTTHGELVRDPLRGSLLLLAGYVAGESGWDSDGLHTVERDDAWGEFAAVIVRTSSSGAWEVVALSDPAAAWPVYHARRDDAVVISNDPHFVAIALGLTELSAQASYELLAYHHSLGVETTIAGVVRLFPGDRLRIEATERGVTTVATDSRPLFRYSDDRGWGEEIERLALDGLRQGIAQIGPLHDGSFADATVQLSGGLDSRLTAAILAEVLPERPDVVTLDLSSEIELAVAREVAARLGYPHRVAHLADTDLATLRVGWLLTGGQVSPFAAAGNILSYETARRGDGGRILLVGAWPGDCLIGSYVPLVPGMRSRVLRDAVLRDWAEKRGRNRTAPGEGVTGPGASRVRREARRRLRRRLLRGSGRTAAQAISFWAMFSRQPAFSYIAPAMLTSHVLPLTPVLARPYLEQLLRLTADQIIGKNFYRAMIAHGFPELRGIINANTGKPVTDSRAVIPRGPSSLNELYSWLPAFAQRLAHVTIGRLHRHTAEEASSAENDHWSVVLGRTDVPALPVGDIVVSVDDHSDVHLRAVAAGLRWTADYLRDAAAQLPTW